MSIIIKSAIILTVLCTWVPLSQAFVNIRQCSTLIEGCGLTAVNISANLCCFCKSFYEIGAFMPFQVHCFLEQLTGRQPTCCPCVDVSLSLSTTSNSGLLECANPKDVRSLIKLVSRQEKLALRTIQKCGGVVTDECLKPPVLEKLRCLSRRTQAVVKSISDDRGL